MRALFILTIFLGAALLFLMQPLVARLFLPLLGGAPAVWNTCMVFFQLLLLAGYGYAHLLARGGASRGRLGFHTLLLATSLIALPIGLRGDPAPPTDGSPLPWLLGMLALAVGPVFFVVSTSAPLLQRWFAGSDDRRAGDPYFLYAASNAGSLLALLAFPILLEPLLTLVSLTRIWSVAYGLFVLCMVGCGLVALRRPVQESERSTAPATAPPPTRRQYAWWLLLAFVPSSLVLGATQHITTDVATVPFLWVIPLALYLLTFVLAFSAGNPLSAGITSGLLLAMSITGLLAITFWWIVPIVVALAIHMLLLFLAALSCHGRLAATRPDPRHLTAFFLTIACGGALGGIFNALLAPLLFDNIIEYPLVIALAVLLRTRSPSRAVPALSGRLPGLALDGLVVILCLLSLPYGIIWTATSTRPLLVSRTFFGAHRVLQDDQLGTVSYYHGTTLHGTQLLADRAASTSYYHENTGSGRLLQLLDADPRPRQVGVIGLGVGALAAWARPGDHFTFFEIDPAVVEIARDSGWFTFLRDSAADQIEIRLGDARLSLADRPEERFDLLFLDAFSSDAVPVHLLTVEAFELYRSRLRPGGLLVINATNRHLHLTRLIAGLAAELDLVALEWIAADWVEPIPERAQSRAQWIAIGIERQDVEILLANEEWGELEVAEDAPVWTDEFSSLLRLLRFRKR